MLKTIVTLPTYNEAENIRKLVEDINSLRISNLEILVVDDASPDGTAEIVQKMMKKNKKLHLLLRHSDRGRGAAGVAGFKKALEMGKTTICPRLKLFGCFRFPWFLHRAPWQMVLYSFARQACAPCLSKDRGSWFKCLGSLRFARPACAPCLSGATIKEKPGLESPGFGSVIVIVHVSLSKLKLMVHGS